MYGTFVPGNENVVELLLLGAKTTWNFHSRERKCHGTFVPGSENDVELSLPRAKMWWNFALSRKWPRFTKNTNGNWEEYVNVRNRE